MKFTVVVSLAFATFASASPQIRQDDSDTLCGVNSVETFDTQDACTAGCTGEFEQCYPHPNGKFECCGTSSCFPFTTLPGPDAETKCNDLCPGPCYTTGDNSWTCRHCEPLTIPTLAPTA